MRLKIWKKMLVFGFGCAAVACSSSDGNDLFGADGSASATTTAATSAGDDTTSTSTSSSTGDDDGDGGDASGDTTTGGILLDVGGGGAGDGGDDGLPADGCKDVDLLFVVDNSGSMADQQQSLVDSFGGFVQGIEQELEGVSYHVGVVSSDAYGANEGGCRAIGDLITQTSGANSSNAVCGPFASGGRYLDENEADLASKFGCIGQVGTFGSDDERMARAMLDALQPGRNDPTAGGCNAGFSRPDSLLVIVMITDEDDVPEPFGCDPDDFFNNPCDAVGSGGTPDEWKAELSGYRPNIDTNVVVLSLVGRSGGSCGAQINSKILGFANRFGDNGFIGDVCAPSYDQFFLEALPVIDDACTNYVPPAG